MSVLCLVLFFVVAVAVVVETFQWQTEKKNVKALFSGKLYGESSFPLFWKVFVPYLDNDLCVH